ncbi:hypothetical protein T459_28098 [Capsicum annuum]|uniref:Uncharacterized protein n=1 Tax=Capsicum annuum TaxID=4072 RepID=A0A2G2YG98_CAPAN|nr:hypothetical protein T459_28098 [Capsicum annuum]
MELFIAITITRKIILEGGLVAVDDDSHSGSGSSTAVGANDAPLTVFETSHYDYDHTGCTDFSPNFSISSECHACKYHDCKTKHNGVINAINALTASTKKMVCTDWSMIEAYHDKMDNPFDVQYVEVIVQQTIGILNCSPFVSAYTKYLSDGLQVRNYGLDAGLLHKRYAYLLWKYGEVKAQKLYASDIKDPRRLKSNSITPDEE